MQITSYKIPQKSVRKSLSFKGLHENIALGKEVTRAFREEFGRLHSNSWVETLIFRRNDFWDTPYETFKLKAKYHCECRTLRGENNAFYKADFGSYQDFIERLKLRMKQLKFGNCGEQSYIINNMLEKKGIQVKQLLLNLYLKGLNKAEQTGVRHCVNIIDYAEPFKFSRPNKWGENAVIIDPWGITSGVIKAKDASAFYSNLFQRPLNHYEFVAESFTCKVVNNKLIIKRGDKLVEL